MMHHLSHSVPFRPFRFAFLALSFALAAGLFAKTDAQGAEITLLDGRVWEGVIVREDKDAVVLETVGGEIEIARRGIKSIDRKPTRRQLYETKLTALDKTDPDQHFLLGLWCRRHRLGREAEYHLNYAVGLDPDHAGARRALGHVKYKDQWMPEKEAKEAQGLRFYKGRWMTKEAAAIEEAEELKRELAEEVAQQVRALAAMIAAPRSEQSARAATRELLALRDPLGYPAILELMRHDSAAVREVAIRAADKFRIAAADREILLHALYDADAEVRDRARKSLEERWNDGMLDETLKALRDAERPAVRFSAALVLGVAKDPDTIDALIDALYLTYVLKVTGETQAPYLGLGGFTTRESGPPGPRGPVIYDSVAGVVGAGPMINWKPLDAPDDDRHLYVINYAALDALRAITGKDFGVNKRAWREWWDENRDELEVWEVIK